MTKEEFKEKLNVVKNKYYLVGVEPKVVSSSEFDYFKEKERIYSEYIESLEKEIEKYKNMTSQEAYEFFIDKWCKELKND